MRKCTSRSDDPLRSREASESQILKQMNQNKKEPPSPLKLYPTRPNNSAAKSNKMNPRKSTRLGNQFFSPKRENIIIFPISDFLNNENVRRKSSGMSSLFDTDNISDLKDSAT